MGKGKKGKKKQKKGKPFTKPQYPKSKQVVTVQPEKEKKKNTNGKRDKVK